MAIEGAVAPASVLASSSGIRFLFTGELVNLGFESPRWYRHVRYARHRRISLLLGIVLVSGSRRLPSSGKCDILEFWESLSCNGKCV